MLVIYRKSPSLEHLMPCYIIISGIIGIISIIGFIVIRGITVRLLSNITISGGVSGFGGL